MMIVPIQNPIDQGFPDATLDDRMGCTDLAYIGTSHGSSEEKLVGGLEPAIVGMMIK